MRCLVTGHKGYIGSHLFTALESLGHDVVGIDLEGSTLEGRELPGEDLCEGIPIEYYEFMPEAIFHLAAIPRVEYSIKNPIEVMKNNVISTSTILKFAKYFKIPLIYSSSSSVMGNGAGPTSPYALSKYTGELETVMYNSLYGVPTVCLRYFNVYSKDQKADGPYATAIANWMEFIRTGKTPYITGDGEQKRDMAHVEDVVSANIFCLNNIDKTRGEVFDVGTGDNISLNQIKSTIKDHFPSLQFEYRDSRPGEVLETKANIKPLKDLGWRPKNPINQGINHCFENLKNSLKLIVES